jgi:hypothetical protein
MNETIEINQKTYESLNKIKEYYYANIKDFNKMELSKKDITKLRKKITQEKEEGYTHILRTISLYTQSLYTQEKDELLRLYTNKLYLKHFPQNS